MSGCSSILNHSTAYVLPGVSGSSIATEKPLDRFQETMSVGTGHGDAG